MKLRHLLLIAVLLLPLGKGSVAQLGSEQQLKAAYLINFLKYVDWPEGHRNSTICLFGRDTMGAYLANYEGRTIAGHELVLRRVASPEQMEGCQLVFVPENEEPRVAAVLRWLEGAPVLTVSDAEFFTRQGGAIALVRGESRLQFDINLNATSRAGLRPSSQMLRLARLVFGIQR